MAGSWRLEAGSSTTIARRRRPSCEPRMASGLARRKAGRLEAARSVTALPPGRAMRPPGPSWPRRPAAARHGPARPRRRAGPAHDQHPVAHAEHLGQIAGDHQHREALPRQLVHELVDLDLGADVDAARRLVEDQEPGSAAAIAEHDLLLVAAGEGATTCSAPRVRTLQPLGAARASSRSRPRVDEPAARSAAGSARERFSPTDAASTSPCALAVLGHVGDAEPARAWPARSHRTGWPPMPDLADRRGRRRRRSPGRARCGPSRPARRGRRSRRPGPSKLDVRDRGRAGEPADLQQGLADRPRLPGYSWSIVRPDHEADQLVGSVVAARRVPTCGRRAAR